MPLPTRAMIHTNQPLTNMSVAYIQSSDKYMARQVFPVVPVLKQSDLYYIYDKAAFFRSDAKKRAPGTESVGTGWKLSDTTYFCDIWALHHDIADPERANTDAPLNLERDAVDLLTSQMLIREELNWVNTYFTTSVWTGSSTGTDITVGSQWGNVASTPLEDVEDEKSAILENTGQEANTLVIGYEVYKELKHHPDLLDRIKYATGTAVVTTSLIAQLMDLDRVLVAKATRNTATETAAADETETMDFILGKHALLCYVAPRPGIKKVSAGYTFAWKGLGFNDTGVKIKTFRMENLESDRVEMEAAYDHKVVASDCGAFFSSVVA